MFSWILKNIGTMVVSMILILIVVLIVAKLIRDKKQGRRSCGCSCDSCPGTHFCHRPAEDDITKEVDLKNE